MIHGYTDMYRTPCEREYTFTCSTCIVRTVLYCRFIGALMTVELFVFAVEKLMMGEL